MEIRKEVMKKRKPPLPIYHGDSYFLITKKHTRKNKMTKFEYSTICKTLMSQIQMKRNIWIEIFGEGAC